ncbi:hypothetical protein MUG87_01320 [Ectobacillus sp. JY-23]|uniref:hypothetical protein n=1 Tax=Ectobacillus sp. JY-23 TaxID=2933872 RepID=UPI001FF42287|nr:hypothetical protein [Ectobacillus sp. JY-23]UOY92815.1 hypothetical protein MUG87_01320 [Ectobacillus sp. JY-23]
MNGLEWTQYKANFDAEPHKKLLEQYHHVFRAVDGEAVYEMTSQGCTVEEIRKLLASFHSTTNP